MEDKLYGKFAKSPDEHLMKSLKLSSHHKVQMMEGKYLVSDINTNRVSAFSQDKRQRTIIDRSECGSKMAGKSYQFKTLSQDDDFDKKALLTLSNKISTEAN